MNPDLDDVESLRRVLESAGQGEGVSSALVRVLRDSGPFMRDTARISLLGYPLSASLRPLVVGGNEEVSILASLIMAAPRSSATKVGQSGSLMASTLERWVKVKESLRLEQRVYRVRGLMTSGVLGAVAAMVATLGPLVANIGLSSQPAVDPRSLLYAGAAMVSLSSAMLGYFMSGRRFPLNVGVSMATFAIAAVVASPLTGVSSQLLWGVK